MKNIFSLRHHGLKIIFVITSFSLVIHFECKAFQNNLPDSSKYIDLIEALNKIDTHLTKFQNVSKKANDVEFESALIRFNLQRLKMELDNSKEEFLKAVSVHKYFTDEYKIGLHFFELFLIKSYSFLANDYIIEFSREALLENKSAGFYWDNFLMSSEHEEFSDDWFLSDLYAHFARVQVNQEVITLGKLVETYEALYEQFVDKMEGIEGYIVEQLLELSRQANWLMMYEQLFITNYGVIMNVYRNVDPTPYQNVLKTFEVGFACLSSTGKKSIIEFSLGKVDYLIRVDKTKDAANLLHIISSILTVAKENFTNKNYFEARINFQQGYLRYKLNQFFVAENYFEIGFSHINGINSFRDSCEMLGFYHRYMGYLRVYSGRYPEAVQHFNSSVENFGKIDHFNLIGSWAGLAQAHFFQDDYVLSIQAAEQGLKDLLLLENKFPAEVLNAEGSQLYLSLVQSYYHSKDYENFEKYVDIAFSIPELRVSLRAMLFMFNGLYEQKVKGNCLQAIQSFKSGLQLLSPEEQSHNTQSLNYHIGKCYFELGEFQQAVTHLEKAIVIDRNRRKVSRRSESYFVQVQSWSEEDLELIIQTLYLAMNGSSVADSTREVFQEKLLVHAELIKSRFITDEIESFHAGASFVAPHISSDEIDEVEELIGDLFPIYDTQSDPTINSREIYSSYKSLANTLAGRHNSNVLILEYIPIVSEDLLLLFVITEDSISMVNIEETWSEIQNKVTYYRHLLERSLMAYSQLKNSPSPALNKSIINKIKILEKEIEHASTELGIILIPSLINSRINLNQSLKDKSLVVVPFGKLHNLPFPSLKVSNGNGKGEYLIDYVNRFASIPSLEILKIIFKYNRANLNQEIKNILFVGDTTNYNLPAVKHEYLELKRHFGNSTSITNKNKALKASIGSSNSVHFAAHAYFQPNAPFDSGIELADSTLTLNEIMYLNPYKTRLVSMGACETSEADVSMFAGDETWGIASGFIHAGVPAVIGSLWKQEGEVSRMFFSHFYELVKNNENIGNAFRGSMLFLKKQEIGDSRMKKLGLAYYANPCFWSGFNLIGE